MYGFLRILLMAASILSLAAAAEKDTYQLSGRILREDGKSLKGITPVVFLYGAIKPYNAQTLAGADGRFKFSKIPAGIYTLAVAIPRAGEVRKTVEVGPSFADSKRRVSVTVSFGGTIPVGKQHGVSAVELSVPDEAMTEYRKAQEHLGRRDVPSAVKCLEKATSLAPQFAAAWNFLGTISYQTRQYRQAEEHFREALNRDPEAYAPLVNLGGALLSQDRFAESLPINQRAVKISPDDPLAHSQLGQSYYYLGQMEEAFVHLKQAKALDPAHFSLPQLFLVEIYARRDQVPEAIAEVEEFLKLHPDSEYAPRMRKALEILRAPRVKGDK